MTQQANTREIAPQRPTIGRIVVYHAPYAIVPPLPAMVTAVHDNDAVDLVVFDGAALVAPTSRGVTSVPRRDTVAEGAMPSAVWDWPPRG